jgi:hypothetical protein
MKLRWSATRGSVLLATVLSSVPFYFLLWTWWESRSLPQWGLCIFSSIPGFPVDAVAGGLWAEGPQCLPLPQAP